MNFDFTSFFNALVGEISGGKDLPIGSYILSLVICLAFFAFKEFVLTKKRKLKKNIKTKVLSFIIETIASWLITLCSLFVVGNTIISCLLGTLSGLFTISKLKLSSKDQGEDNSKEDANDDKETTTNNNSNVNNNTNNVNVVVNNNLEENVKDKISKLLPDFYDPKNVKLPDGIGLQELNLVMVLEMYGYISANQKHKMLYQSLFETTDEQVMKLLDMYVLNEEELKEAKATLNLIKYNNRLVTKEEVLLYIKEYEANQKKGESNAK